METAWSTGEMAVPPTEAGGTRGLSRKEKRYTIGSILDTLSQNHKQDLQVDGSQGGQIYEFKAPGKAQNQRYKFMTLEDIRSG